MKEAKDAFSKEYEAYISMKGALEWRLKVLQVLQGSSAMIQDGLACFEKGDYFEAGYSENTFEYPETEIRTWKSEEDFIKRSPPNERNLVYDEMNGKFILLWKEDRYKKSQNSG